MAHGTEARGCKGKLRHKTVEQAEAHIERMVARGAPRDRWSVYPTPPQSCKFCGGWHVGHRSLRHRR